MISEEKYKKVCRLLGERPQLIYDGKNSTVLKLRGKQIVKCVKNKYFFDREVKGYNLLQSYFKDHLPRRYYVNDKLQVIIYKLVDLPSLQQILLGGSEDNKSVLLSYRIFLNEIFQIVCSSRIEKEPRKNSGYFYNTNWHINKLVGSNHPFIYEGVNFKAKKLFTQRISVKGQDCLSINDSLKVAKGKYESARPNFSVVLHGDENATNILMDLSKPVEWYLIDPQWCVSGADWVVLVLELFNGWRKYILPGQKDTVMIRLDKNNRTAIEYDLSKNNWPILREMDKLLFAKASECSASLGDTAWFQRFKSFYLFKSVRGGIWGHLENPMVTAVSMGEGLRIYGARDPAQVLEGL